MSHMKKNVTCLCAFFIYINLALPQTTSYSFEYIGAQETPSCNPLKEFLPPFVHNWKLSHGSPSCVRINGQSYNSVKLISSFKENEAEEKGDGLFINYNFYSARKYDIEIRFMHIEGYEAGFRLFAANNIYEGTNTKCVQETTPFFNSKQLILEDLYYDEDNFFQSRTMKNWSPNQNFNQLWVTSWQPYYGVTGALCITEIIVTDLGAIENDPPTVPRNFSLSTITSNSIKMTWSSSQDASGIKHYQISKNNSANYITTSNTYYISNSLTPCTSYNFKIRAVDFGGNVSNWTPVLTGVTLSSGPLTTSSNRDLSSIQYSTLKAQKEIILLPGFKYLPKNANCSFQTELGCITGKTNISAINDIIYYYQKDVTVKDNKTLEELDIIKDECFTLYPNPVKDLINITFNDYISHELSIVIYNTLGTVIHRSSVNQSNVNIDISEYPSGIYIVQVIDGHKISQKQVIKI